MIRSLRLLLIFTFAFGASGFVSAATAETRVFELRTYTATPGKLDALLARFRNHTCALFTKHGMTNIGYWLPTDDKDGASRKLVYLLAHESRDAAKASWAAFIADPEWKAVHAASEANGSLVEKIDSVYLNPADFSAIK
ncbi:MAG TPA: NIPSNAP family protein [Opitutus sp.]|nr:NIPSNAP family protein [Opitutus sp.]